MTTTSDDAPTVVASNLDDGTPTDHPTAPSDWDAKLQRVDRYFLLHRLGQGAFGVVRAAYDPELDRKVAIKLLRRDGTGSIGSTVQDPRALLDEPRMAAKLAHPNVVAIHDVGPLRTADGIYIVMEHLGGPSLLDWLEGSDRRRSWKEILEVLLAAGRGLSAAHAQGMVHRDFKPQNLRFGDDGRIRVLDFGLAQLSAQLHRKSDTVVGTPAFIAPEQHVGEPADARSDQYAFCVSLWRCLYGHHPHERETLLELAKAKLVRLPAPSDPAVPGWIGALLCRGLEPRPDERFPDMQALLAALADDPIARRRRRLLGTGLTLTLVAGGYGIATLASHREDPCTLPPDHFSGTWDDDARARVAASFGRSELPYAEAALQAARAGLDEYLQGWTDARAEVCRASLDRGERSIDEASGELECLDRQLRRVAAVSSTFQQADDAVILHAAELVAGLPPPASCRQPERSARSRRSAASEAALALEERIAEAENLTRIGDYTGSLALAESIATEAEAAGDPTSLTHAWLAEGMAALQDRKFERALEAALAAHGLAIELGDSSSAGRALVLLVAIRRAQGNYDETELLAKVAAGVVAQAGPAVQVDFAFQLGALAQERNRWDEAFARLAEARALAESLYGEGHLQVADIELVQGITNSASKRDFQAALRHFEHVRSIYRSHYGELHPRVASTYNNIGGVYFRQGEWDRAIVEFEKALEIYASIHGDQHPLTLRALSNLGAAEYLRGNTERAIELLERALVLREQALGKAHPEYVSAEANLAVMLLQSGHPRRALPLSIHAHERTAQMHGEQGSEALALAGMVATVASLLGERDTAARYDAIVTAGLTGLAEDDPQRSAILEHAADAARRAGDHQAALRLSEQRLALVGDPGGLEAALAVAGVGEALVELGRHEEARTRLEAALAIVDARDDVTPERTVGLLGVLARAEQSLGHREAARVHHGELVRRLERSDRGLDSLAKAHLALAVLATDPDDRNRHAQACITLLERTGFTPDRLAEARALLDAK